MEYMACFCGLVIPRALSRTCLAWQGRPQRVRVGRNTGPWCAASSMMTGQVAVRQSLDFCETLDPERSGLVCAGSA